MLILILFDLVMAFCNNMLFNDYHFAVLDEDGDCGGYSDVVWTCDGLG